MSKEQNDRHIIWSNMNLEVADWRDGYEEYLEINELSDDPNDENKLYEYMVETNDEYLSDERANLNVRLSQPIIVIGELGRWNGRVMGYKMIDSGNIKDCLYSDTDYTEWYADKYGDLRADESARKDDSVRAMLRIEPKPRRNAGRRMTVISTRSVCANNAAKSFIRTAQGRGFVTPTARKPISKPKKKRNAMPKRESTPSVKRSARYAASPSGRPTVRRCCAPRNAKPSIATKDSLPIIIVSNPSRKPEKQYTRGRPDPARLGYRAGGAVFSVPRPQPAFQRIPHHCGRHYHYLCQRDFDADYRLTERKTIWKNASAISTL